MINNDGIAAPGSTLAACTAAMSTRPLCGRPVVDEEHQHCIFHSQDLSKDFKAVAAGLRELLERCGTAPADLTGFVLSTFPPYHNLTGDVIAKNARFTGRVIFSSAVAIS